MMNVDREKYCPNMFIDTPDVSVGEFKTMPECMSFPITEKWCINRKNGNKFDKYKSQGNRILIICCWNRNDAWRFVVAIVKNGVKYFDLNDLPMDLVSDKFEEYLGEDIVNKIHSINNLSNNNEIKEYNMKQTIRLNERELHRLISESVKSTINEVQNTHSVHKVTDGYGYYKGDFYGTKETNEIDEEIQYLAKRIEGIFKGVRFVMEPAKVRTKSTQTRNRYHDINSEYNSNKPINKRNNITGMEYVIMLRFNPIDNVSHFDEVIELMKRVEKAQRVACNFKKDCDGKRRHWVKFYIDCIEIYYIIEVHGYDLHIGRQQTLNNIEFTPNYDTRRVHGITTYDKGLLTRYEPNQTRRPDWAY